MLWAILSYIISYNIKKSVEKMPKVYHSTSIENLGISQSDLNVKNPPTNILFKVITTLMLNIYNPHVIAQLIMSRFCDYRKTMNRRENFEMCHINIGSIYHLFMNGYINLRFSIIGDTHLWMYLIDIEDVSDIHKMMDSSKSMGGWNRNNRNNRNNSNNHNNRKMNDNDDCNVYNDCDDQDGHNCRGSQNGDNYVWDNLKNIDKNDFSNSIGIELNLDSIPFCPTIFRWLEPHIKRELGNTKDNDEGIDYKFDIAMAISNNWNRKRLESIHWRNACICAMNHHIRHWIIEDYDTKRTPAIITWDPVHINTFIHKTKQKVLAYRQIMILSISQAIKLCTKSERPLRIFHENILPKWLMVNNDMMISKNIFEVQHNPHGILYNITSLDYYIKLINVIHHLLR